MERSTFYFLVYLIGPKLDNIPFKGREQIDVVKQILIAIYVLATPDSFRSISERFDVSKSTAWFNTKRVVRAIYSIRNQFIRWPTYEEAENTWTNIQTLYGFPKVLDIIDGTHINIPRPKEDANSYINRKGKFSIQLQVICKSDLSFIHVFAGMPGCVHDMRVFLYSGIQQYCTPEYFPDDSHLLGDAAYSVQKNVIVPFQDNGHLTREQKRFNHRLSSARIIVERSIGLLKGRWRYLLDKLPMTRTNLSPYYIITCCVLHNICLLRNDRIEIPIIVPEILHEMQPVAVPDNLKEEGNIKRNRLMQILSHDNFERIN
ncbi:protein ANTAGONIST OF LIKE HETEROCHROMATIN PROTEIN 1-like [Monomorium pharaonis]|uniref:protein ANTAGONIST OF LIKE HETEROCHROMATIN PROTEIN 1-like n=1 Tax=Monomorium pharaonis TaxID=307658 RepID=UPI00102E1C3A|nr:protein ANTAGONIST OF LIKE HETEROCHROMATIN PROTEIN 1-like [Monomorium pharaonis]